MDDPLKLLSIVREYEFNFPGSDEKRLKNILEQALKKWEDVDFVSFATAFEIQGQLVVDVFNRLVAPDKDENDVYLDEKIRKMLVDRYMQFLELIQYPPAGKGLWPWDIMRLETLGAVGAFPPKVIVLNRMDTVSTISEKDRLGIANYGSKVLLEDFSRPSYQEINFNQLAADFSQITDLETLIAKSWQWLAIYPCVLAEEMKLIRKGSQRDATVLLYLLGTRKEFAKRPQNDYGLIVGLTDDVLKEEKLSEVVDAIIFAWNMLAVSPHILEDGLKIAHLEAGRHTVHTVRTYMNVQALPIIKFIVDKYIESESAKELVINLINEIATLPAMMSFVSRRPLDNLENSVDSLRVVDYSEYDLIEVIANFFKEELEEKRGFEIESKIKFTKKEQQKLAQNNQWVNELYLRSALSEVVSNIEKNSQPGSQVKLLISIVKNSERDELLKIKITNHLNPDKLPIYEYDRQRSPIHGLKSLEAFFEALGGHAKGQLDADGSTYSTVMDYNLTRWEKGIKLLRLQENK